MLFNLLQDATGTTGSQGLGFSTIMIVAMIAIFYFLLIRPQKKQEKETKKMIDALKKGDKIVTIGGIYGVVSSVKDNSVVVKVDSEAKIEFTKTAIARVVNESEEKAVAKTAKDKESSKDDK
ncbi:MAG: preprotein translocase subunit YajC [Treponema sp.]|nr:preprotein translocase subunit YajC [Candidatus Treponema scatequi]